MQRFQNFLRHNTVSMIKPSNYVGRLELLNTMIEKIITDMEEQTVKKLKKENSENRLVFKLSKQFRRENNKPPDIKIKYINKQKNDKVRVFYDGGAKGLKSLAMLPTTLIIKYPQGVMNYYFGGTTVSTDPTDQNILNVNDFQDLLVSNIRKAQFYSFLDINIGDMNKNKKPQTSIVTSNKSHFLMYDKAKTEYVIKPGNKFYYVENKNNTDNNLYYYDFNKTSDYVYNEKFKDKVKEIVEKKSNPRICAITEFDAIKNLCEKELVKYQQKKKENDVITFIRQTLFEQPNFQLYVNNNKPIQFRVKQEGINSTAMQDEGDDDVFSSHAFQDEKKSVIFNFVKLLKNLITIKSQWSSKINDYSSLGSNIKYDDADLMI